MDSYKSSRGFTVIELVAGVSLFSILASFSVFYFQSLSYPTDVSTTEVIALYKQVRARAISTTSAYIIIPTTSGLSVRYRDKCNSTETWVVDNGLSYSLPEGASFKSTTWFVCINSRGFPDANVNFEIEDVYGNESAIEIFYGGAIDKV